MTSNTAEVAIHDLTRHIGAVRALDGVSLEIPTGETLAVLGPSGCGKSTLLRLLAGLDTPTGGEIHIAGQKVNGNGLEVPPERRPVNMVFQDFALWPHMSVEKIIAFGMKHRGIPRNRHRARIQELLELLSLEGLEKRYPRQLSGGQQQRVAIARALATEPRVLLFDEPLSNLDSQLRAQMRDDLALLLREVGATAMYVTHDLQEALTLGDQLVVMREGRVEQMDHSDTVFHAPASQWVAGLLGYSNILRGEITGTDAQWAHARIGDHAVKARLSHEGLGPGDPIKLMIQPESMQIHGDHQGLNGHNLVSGHVSQCHYEGHGYRVRVTTQDTFITVHSLQPWKIGEETGIRFDPVHTLLYRG